MDLHGPGLQVKGLQRGSVRVERVGPAQQGLDYDVVGTQDNPGPGDHHAVHLLRQRLGLGIHLTDRGCA